MTTASDARLELSALTPSPEEVPAIEASSLLQPLANQSLALMSEPKADEQGNGRSVNKCTDI
jgi:hypothetical protein